MARPQSPRDIAARLCAIFIFAPYERLYRARRNPWHAWMVLRDAQARHVAIPPWVIACLAERAPQVMTATSVKAIAKALGLTRRSRKQAITELNYLAICDHVMIETWRRRRRAPNQAVFDHVAQQVRRKWKPMTAANVRKIYYQWRPLSTRRGIPPPYEVYVPPPEGSSSHPD
jgi:hypothetical protein